MVVMLAAAREAARVGPRVVERDDSRRKGLRPARRASELVGQALLDLVRRRMAVRNGRHHLIEEVRLHVGIHQLRRDDRVDRAADARSAHRAECRASSPRHPRRRRRCCSHCCYRCCCRCCYRCCPLLLPLLLVVAVPASSSGAAGTLLLLAAGHRRGARHAENAQTHDHRSHLHGSPPRRKATPHARRERHPASRGLAIRLPEAPTRERPGRLRED